MDPGAAGEGDEDGTLVTMARYSGHGLTLALAVGLFLLLGWWVDERIGSTPVFMILGAMVGAAAGFYHILQHLLLRPRAKEEERRARGSKEVGGDAGE